MRKVLIATPSYDGALCAWYVNALLGTVRLLAESGAAAFPVFMCYDALIQRARNDLFRIAVEGGYSDMIFIDADMEWNPEWVLKLLLREEDVVGGTYRKKTDEAERYACKVSDLMIHENGLIKAEGLGTGFVKISRRAFMAAWEASEEYENEGRVCRMVCDVKVVNRQLHSEDTVLSSKLSAAGFQSWLDPNMTCNHVGIKKFTGNFANYAQRLREQITHNTDKNQGGRI